MSGDKTNDRQEKDFVAAILAGGKGERLGTNKALLEIGGRTLLDRIIDQLKEIFTSILLVVQDDDFTPVPVCDVQIKVVDRKSVV